MYTPLPNSYIIQDVEYTMYFIPDNLRQNLFGGCRSVTRKMYQQIGDHVGNLCRQICPKWNLNNWHWYLFSQVSYQPSQGYGVGLKIWRKITEQCVQLCCVYIFCQKKLLFLHFIYLNLYKPFNLRGRGILRKRNGKICQQCNSYQLFWQLWPRRPLLLPGEQWLWQNAFATHQTDQPWRGNLFLYLFSSDGSTCSLWGDSLGKITPT